MPYTNHFRFLNKVETFVDDNMPVKSDTAMKSIFGDQRVWPCVVARLQKSFPPGATNKYDMMVIRNNLFDSAYVKKRTLTDQKRRRGEDVSISLYNYICNSSLSKENFSMTIEMFRYSLCP